MNYALFTYYVFVFLYFKERSGLPKGFPECVLNISQVENQLPTIQTPHSALDKHLTQDFSLVSHLQKDRFQLDQTWTEINFFSVSVVSDDVSFDEPCKLNTCLDDQEPPSFVHMTEHSYTLPETNCSACEHLYERLQVERMKNCE